MNETKDAEKLKFINKSHVNNLNYNFRVKIFKIHFSTFVNFFFF